STVSKAARDLINAQTPPNAQPSVTDASLKKSAIGPGYTAIPLPAFVYNRNEGAWIGALMPIFRANAQGHIEDIYAPLYLHNDLIGETFTFNYFGYRSDTRQYHAIVSYATKVERSIDLSYKDISFGGGRYIVSLQANAGKSAFNRFFGFGNRAGEQKESNYALGDTNLKAGVGVNLGHSLSLLATERLRFVSIGNGVVSSLPQTRRAFPTAPGLDGATILGQSLTFAYDSRDNQLTPLHGTYATLMAEHLDNFETDNRDEWWRLTAEARNFLPHFDDRAVLVTHALLDALPIDSKGLVLHGVPFYERPTLGGETTLRGFGRGRFVGSYALLLNVEERVSVVHRSIMGNVVEVELAPFLDCGRVDRHLTTHHTFGNLQYNPGLGVRVLARPNIAGRLDVAYGRDGAAVYVGLDYPF
ncbi:MAG: BamA/TamA family outer membrane protein, partial [Elusimicrobia bacterium]|nr:BamA/TamA family outer membrane protein [Elusimicrobiota bacterium]